ncbi:hypothetical protein BTH42_24320 [Burkholderia sp. SRS-W-2-2016]|uniref:PAAR domain-containing protein n=1 Tax=Burkholderia sp. SRS-W-2-2016 TaxID=1926878 RepID=UPI00094AB89D|nr:PAAR domain-containing protein [Burkholderia sp. SRS-W-2-2016]OLL29063.1 hypothetical protein BTH42_24320 [Burkholderia sp. SRS-W-2-2016]
MKKPVCEGDPTTHGGVVKQATSTFRLNGRMVALHYDIVTCPLHGDNQIIEHGEGYSEGGRKWVVDDCATECGSRVIAKTKGMKIR